MAEEMPYHFYVHCELPAWRLVLHADIGWPRRTTADQWSFTRARGEADTNADVRYAVAQQGFCLFKIGALSTIWTQTEKRAA